jgi:hypothetical protein
MKKFIITLLVLFSAINFSFAQWTGTTDIYNTNSGNVGIGTTSPASKLEIVASTNNSSIKTGSLELQSYAINNSWIGDNTYFDGSNFVYRNSGYASQLYFHNGGISFSTGENGGAGGSFLLNTRMTILNSGNVGIGTTNPGAKLDILNSVNGSMSLQAGANDFGQAFYYAEDTRPNNVNTPRVVMHLSAQGTPNYAYGQRWYLKEGKNGGPVADATDKGTNQLIFSTATAEDLLATPTDIMTLVGNGKVGIGTTNPTAALQLGDFGNGSSTQLVIPGTYNFEQMRLGQIGNGNMAMEFVNHNGGLSSDGIKFLVSADAGAPGLQMQYATPATAYSTLSYQTGLYMNFSGNIAIGTTNVPTGYKLAIAGNAIAESMTVKLQANWPDVVFKKNYALMPLSEVKTYIDKNQHLPEIPAAAEVEKDGVNLGEMNRLLVKKVEELTLYLIEKDKEEKSQQQQINELKKQMEILVAASRKAQ